jgi:hypothetical protein
MNCRIVFLSLSLLLFFRESRAQNQFSGWLASFNSFKLNHKWSIHFDGQLRSGDQIGNVQTILLRPGVNYHFSKHLYASAGYAYVDNRRTMGAVTNYIPEQRIWEQLVLSHKFKSIGMSHRLRAEQRFLPIVVVDNEALRVVDHAMAHRFRYFLRNIIPFQKAPSFTEGVYFALQNEVFFNVAGKRNVNGKLFDQNRLYGALGYRLPRTFDLEAGYMYQYIKTAGGSINNHVVQLALYKRL